MTTRAGAGPQVRLSHIVYPDSAPLWSWIVGHLMYGLGVWLVAWPRVFRAQS